MESTGFPSVVTTGKIIVGERYAMVTCAPALHNSSAISKAELPTPTTTTTGRAGGGGGDDDDNDGWC